MGLQDAERQQGTKEVSVLLTEWRSPHTLPGAMSIVIRPWTRADLPLIRELLLRTWLDAYGAFIPQRDLADYLEANYSQPKLEGMLVDPDVCGYVAELDGAVAGYMKLHHNRSQERFYLQQLYILPEQQGRRLGRRLLTSAEDRARALGLAQLWLGVMVKNARAVGWYRKMGYTVTETTPFVMGATTVDHYIGYLPLPLRPLAGEHAD